MSEHRKWKMIMFDLDGTLLPMDQDTFLKCYMGMLGKFAAPKGYDPQALIRSLWEGTGDMVRNDGSCLNYDRFWASFARTFGQEALKDIGMFDSFYTEQFDNAKVSCGFNPMAATVIEHLKQLGYRLVLATNPVFPHMATDRRIKWAGLDKSDFEYVTTYENSRHCKPNPDYYREILSIVGLEPSDCLMVGNDVGEDMVGASSIGMDVFLVTDCLINTKNLDASKYPQGTLEDLLAFVEA